MLQIFSHTMKTTSPEIRLLEGGKVRVRTVDVVRIPAVFLEPFLCYFVRCEVLVTQKSDRILQLPTVLPDVQLDYHIVPSSPCCSPDSHAVGLFVLGEISSPSHLSKLCCKANHSCHQNFTSPRFYSNLVGQRLCKAHRLTDQSQSPLRILVH